MYKFYEPLKDANPKIVSHLDITGREYFEIEYYDKTENEVCRGFGSFDRDNCVRWLLQFFV